VGNPGNLPGNTPLTRDLQFHMLCGETGFECCLRVGARAVVPVDETGVEGPRIEARKRPTAHPLRDAPSVVERDAYLAATTSMVNAARTSLRRRTVAS